MSDQQLSGAKSICDYVKRPWNTVCDWIKEESFPAVKLEGRWESRKHLIDDWMTQKIMKKGPR